MKKYKWLGVTIILMSILLGHENQSAPAVAAPMQQAGTLTNPSFEDPYSSGAAQGWARWHRESGAKPENCSDAYAFRPSWSREGNPSIVQNGFISQHIGNQFDTWHGGVMQTLPATAGTTYRFSFWSTGRASNEQYPVPSDSGVNLGVHAGIDPNGSGLWTDADIVWGGSGSPHMTGGTGNWQQFSVEATASGSQITVFVGANLAGANQCRRHLDVWFDNAELVEVGPPATATVPPPPPPPPAPVVTNTPIPPTATATPDATATNTPIPTDTPTNTPVPPMGGTICVNAFSDENQNGANDDTEGAMAGVTFVVANTANEVVAQGISSGPSAVCFEELPEGSYQVAQEVPPALEMTTSGNVAISLLEGQQVMIEFGSRLRPAGDAVADTNTGDTTNAGDTTATDPANDTGTGGNTGAVVQADDGGFPIAAVAGLSVLCLAVMLLGGIVVIVLRQQRTSA